MHHSVGVERNALAAQGLYPIERYYRKWLEVAGINVIEKPKHWHNTGRGSGTLTHALYVPAWVRDVVTLFLSATSRRGIVITLARCTPEEREARMQAGHAAWVLGAEPRVVAQVYKDEMNRDMKGSAP